MDRDMVAVWLNRALCEYYLHMPVDFHDVILYSTVEARLEANSASSLGQFHFEEVHLVAFWDQTLDRFFFFFPYHWKHLVKQSFDKHVLSLGKCFEQ